MAPPSSNSDLHRLPHDLFGRAQPNRCPPGRHRKHDLGSYIWLAYSIFFFIQPIMTQRASYWLQQTGIFAVFLVLYISYVQFERRALRLALIAGIFLLGVLTIPNNGGGSCFFIYVGAMLPFCVDSAAVLVAAMLVEIAVLALENHLRPDNPFNYLITGFFTLIVGLSNLFVARQKRTDQKLREAQEENLTLAAVAERERIARDLHDVLGHTLSVIVLKAELAGRLLGRDNLRAASEIADVERTARTALAEVREAIGGYRYKGLGAEVEQARLTLDSAGVELLCESRPPTLRAREETVLSLAMREAVTNIVRHAQATRCTMRFATTSDGFASLEIEDNGAADLSREGNGIRGMRERVHQLGGRFSIEADNGTKLVIELPEAALSAR